MATDLETALQTRITEDIAPNLINSLLAKPPFITLPGSFNARDLSDGHITLEQGHIFRAGSLEGLSEGGRAMLTGLGIETVFDLRSLKERTSEPDPEIDGIENRWCPSTDDNTTTVPAPKSDEKDGRFTFTKMYWDMLYSHKAGIQAVFEHVLQGPQKPFLFHCTAGKDRTGLVAALILAVVGAPLKYINYDYALSRIGTEPAKGFLTQKLTGGHPKEIADRMMSSPKMREYAKVPGDVWTEVFEKMDMEFGGVEGYLTSELGFSEEQFEQIKMNLVKRRSC